MPWPLALITAASALPHAFVNQEHPSKLLVTKHYTSRGAAGGDTARGVAGEAWLAAQQWRHGDGIFAGSGLCHTVDAQPGPRPSPGTQDHLRSRKGSGRGREPVAARLHAHAARLRD